MYADSLAQNSTISGQSDKSPQKGVGKQVEKFQKKVYNHNCGEGAAKVQAFVEAGGVL